MKDSKENAKEIKNDLLAKLEKLFGNQISLEEEIK